MQKDSNNKETENENENQEYLLWKKTYGYEWYGDAVRGSVPTKPEQGLCWLWQIYRRNTRSI